MERGKTMTQEPSGEEIKEALKIGRRECRDIVEIEYIWESWDILAAVYESSLKRIKELEISANYYMNDAKISREYSDALIIKLNEAESELRELRGAIACHEITPEVVRTLRTAIDKSSVIPYEDKEVPLIRKLNEAESRVKELEAELKKVREWPQGDYVLQRDQYKAERDKLEAALKESQAWKEPRLKRNQICGCVVCICEGDQCLGCGGKACGNHPGELIPNPVYEMHPLLAELDRLQKELRGHVHLDHWTDPRSSFEG